MAVFRVVFGVVLLGYLATRVVDGNFVAFHTAEGVLPNYAVLTSVLPPNAWSLLNAASTRAEAAALFGVFALAFGCLTVGFRTQLAAIVTLVALISLYNRNVLLANASMMLMIIGAYWAVFLPLGEVWSVDAWLRRRTVLASAVARPMRRASVAVWGLRLHLAAIYFLNFVHKVGETWTSGQAVHYVLWQDRYATWFGVWFRAHEPAWFSPVATYGTLLIEAAIPVLLLSPVAGRLCRRVAALLIVLLHVGIALFVNLGPFPFVLPCLALLVLASDDWDRFETKADDPETSIPRSTGIAPWVSFPPAAREIFYLMLIVLVFFKLWEDNDFPRRHLGAPPSVPALSAAAAFANLPQSWKLFSPDAPTTDLRIVVDAVRSDGSHIDPLTGAPPDFSFRDGPLGINYLWQTYQGHLVHRNRRDLWVHLLNYIDRLPKLERWPGSRAFDSVEIWVLSAKRPAYGQPRPEPHRALAARRKPKPKTSPPAIASVPVVEREPLPAVSETPPLPNQEPDLGTGEIPLQGDEGDRATVQGGASE